MTWCLLLSCVCMYSECMAIVCMYVRMCVRSMPLCVYAVPVVWDYFSVLWLLLSSLRAAGTRTDNKSQSHWDYSCGWEETGSREVCRSHDTALVLKCSHERCYANDLLKTSWCLSNHVAPSMVTGGRAAERQNHTDADRWMGRDDRLNGFWMCINAHWGSKHWF